VIVALRVLLLVVAAGALAVAIAVGVRGRQSDVAEVAEVAAVRYACPMHREVRAAGPGECPICRMALEQIGRPAGGRTRGSGPDVADLAAVENVRKHNVVDFVRKRSLLVPARELRGPAVVDPDGAVSALFYDDEIVALALDETGVFIPTATPGAPLVVRRLAGPSAPSDTSTAWIRFRFERPTGRAPARGFAPPVGPGTRASPTPGRPGQVGWLELAPRPRQVLAVPASAILQSPEGPYVLAWTGVGFNFEKRPITIGETFSKQGFAVVLSGLRVDERVVSRATFFLEADRRATSRAVETGWSNL